MWILIGFHFILLFFNEKKKFSFMASHLLFWKTIWIEKKIWSMKFLKNNIKCSKTLLFSVATRIAFLVWKMLKFGFLYFWKSCRELNFLSNTESIGIWRRNLESKYETDAEDNTSSASSFKIQIGINTKSVPSYLNKFISSLRFRRKLITYL